jgi:hypothetical protein
MAVVEVDDAPDAVLVAVGVRDHRMGREDEPVGLEHDMVRHMARGGEDLAQQRLGHRERLARVVESGLVRGIDGKLAGRADVDAGEVADRAVELRVAEPPGQDGARIAGVPGGFAVAGSFSQETAASRLPARAGAPPGRHLLLVDPDWT